MTLDLETSSIMQNHILFIINACHNLWSRNLPHPLSSEQASVIQSSAEETKTAPNGRVQFLWLPCHAFFSLKWYINLQYMTCASNSFQAACYWPAEGMLYSQEPRSLSVFTFHENQDEVCDVVKYLNSVLGSPVGFPVNKRLCTLQIWKFGQCWLKLSLNEWFLFFLINKVSPRDTFGISFG